MPKPTQRPRRPPSTPGGSRFAAIAHQLLVRERKRPLRDVATALGLSYAALHARVSGRVPFAPLEINLLLHEVPDLRLVDALLRHTRFVGVEKPHPGRAAGGMPALDAALATLRAVSALVEDIALAQEGRSGNGAGPRDPEQRLEEAQRGMAALALALPPFLAAMRRRMAAPRLAASPAATMPHAAPESALARPA
jgi:hypothetical protein